MTALTTGAFATPASMKSNKVPTGYSQGRLQQFTPEQFALFSQLMGGAGAGIGPGLEHLAGLAAGDQSKFAEMEAPALRQFSALQGQLGSRFSGMGSGARRSSGFGLAGGAAAQELAERLQGNRMALQQQAIAQLLGLGTSLLGQRPYEQFLTKSPWLELGGGLASGIGQGLGQFAAMKMGKLPGMG